MKAFHKYSKYILYSLKIKKIKNMFLRERGKFFKQISESSRWCLNKVNIISFYNWVYLGSGNQTLVKLDIKYYLLIIKEIF